MDPIKPEAGKRFIAKMETSLGEMRLEMYDDKAPKTVSNFIRLARQNFYDGLTFHRIIKNFMVQGGCPKGNGMGGPGYTIPAEFNDIPHEKGVISMARGADPDSAGSQFFIVHAPHATHLDGAYTAFGKVVEGLDVLDNLAGLSVEWNGSERSKPVEKVEIRSLSIVEEEIPVESGESPAESDGTGEGDNSEE